MLPEMPYKMDGNTYDLTSNDSLSRSQNQPGMPTDGANYHLPNEIWQNIFGFLDLADRKFTLRICSPECVVGS